MKNLTEFLQESYDINEGFLDMFKNIVDKFKKASTMVIIQYSGATRTYKNEYKKIIDSLSKSEKFDIYSAQDVLDLDLGGARVVDIDPVTDIDELINSASGPHFGLDEFAASIQQLQDSKKYKNLIILWDGEFSQSPTDFLEDIDRFDKIEIISVNKNDTFYTNLQRNKNSDALKNLKAEFKYNFV